MGRNLDEVIKSLPAGRQAKIAKLSAQKVEEMLAHAATLSDFRKAVGKTQSEVAKELGVNQNAISQLEKRSDTYVSTLRRFLKSLGMTLELSVVAKNGARIDLPNFLPWRADDSATNDPQAFPLVAKAPDRKLASRTTPAKRMAPTRKSTPNLATKKAVSKRKISDGMQRA